MDEDRLNHLVAGFCEGSLDDAAEGELLAHMQQSAEARALLARHVLLQRLLREAGRPALDVGRVLAALPREDGATVAGVMRALPATPRRFSARARWTAASALALAAAVALFVGTRGPRNRGDVAGEPVAIGGRGEGHAAAAPPARPAAAVLEHAEGRVQRGDGPALVVAYEGDRLGAGETVVTASGKGAARLRLPDGTRVELGAATRVSVEPAGDGASVTLHAGLLLVEQPPGRPRPIATAHGRVLGPGARFLVLADARRTRVEVQAGLVSAERPGLPGVTVRAGQYAEVTATAIGAGVAATRALLVGGTVNRYRRLDADDVVAARLVRLGFDVVRRFDHELTSTDVRGVGLVLVSSSVDVERLDVRLREVPVPLVVAEPWLFDDLGMTAAGNADNQSYFKTDLAIVRPDHPLAAGLSGVVKVTTELTRVGFGRPNGVAITIASYEGALDQAALFAYDKGAAMPGLEAPARRVGLFVHDGTALVLTDAGWALFDAAVRWAAAPPDAP